MKLSPVNIGIAALVAAVLFAHMLPIRYLGHWASTETNDVLHVLGFAILAFAAAKFAMPALQARFTSAIVQYAIVAGAIACLGVASEASQYFTSRDADPFDVLRDFSGVAAGLSAYWAWAARARRSLIGIAAALILLGLGLFQPLTEIAALRHERRSFPVLANFESFLDLRAAMTMSVDARTIDAPQAWGGDGHVALLQPNRQESYHGIAFTDMPRDWHAYSRLVLRASAESPSVLTVRINDMAYTGGFADRFNRDFEIDEQPRVISIPLSDVENGPVNRKLNLKNIERVAIYVDNRMDTFMLDDIRLE